MGDFDQVAEFYDIDYPDTSDHQFLRRLVDVWAPAHLVESPCGSGRNVPLLLGAATGRVTFVDRSPSMIREARRLIPDRDRARARAVCADMTSLDVGDDVDLLVCPREAFQLLSRSEARRALRLMSAALTDEGLIVVDLFDFAARRVTEDDAPPDYFTPGMHDWTTDWIRTARDGSIVARHRRHEVVADAVRFEMRYDVHPPVGGRTQTLDLDFAMVTYPRPVFEEMVAACGLETLAVAAGYRGRPSGGRDSARSVYVLGKQTGQQGPDRLDRVHRAITPGERVADRDRADVRGPGGLDVGL